MAGPGGIPDADWTKAKAYGAKYGVDPLLLVAIGFQETNWGKAGLGTKGLILGVGAYDSGATMKYAGLDKQLDQGAKILKQHGVTTIDDVRAGRARFWATDPQWASGVSANYNKLIKDVDKKGIQIPGTGITIPGTQVFDVPSAISNSTNAFLGQARKMGISFLVFTGAALIIIMGLIILFRKPLEEALDKGTELVTAK
jgi:hypothetical protein